MFGNHTNKSKVYSITKSYMVKWNTAVFLLNSYVFRPKSAIIRWLTQFLKRNIKNVMYNTYFRCYTVHDVESLNHYTNHCTHVKFTH